MTRANHNKNEGLATALKAGALLGIFLKPSADIDRRSGTGSYIEHLKLPHAIIRDDAVWAFQEHHQPNHIRGKSFEGFGYYAYTNAADIFANVGYDSRVSCLKDPQVMVQLMSTGRYEVLEWRINQATKMVWSSDDPENTEAYRNTIETGADFHMVLEAEDGVYHIHPVHYPFLLEADEAIHIQTHTMFYPIMFENSGLLTEIERASPGMMQFDDLAGREEVLWMRAQARSTYFSARGKGQYYELLDIFKTDDRPYKSMRIFARQ